MRDDTTPCIRLDSVTPAERSLHNNFIVSIRDMKKSLVRAAFYLAEIADRKLHTLMGFKTAAAYGAAAAGLSPRQCRELIRVGRHLRHLPELASAVEQGSLSWSKTRLIVARASPATQNDWLEFARNSGRLEIEQRLKEIRTRSAGAASTPTTQPPDPNEPRAAPDATMQTVPAVYSPTPSGTSSAEAIPEAPKSDSTRAGKRFPVTLSFDTEQYSRWESIITALRKTGRHQKLPDLHISALDSFLSASGAKHRGPGYFITLIQCPQCGRGELNTSRGPDPAPRALLRAAACDAIIERENNGAITRRSVVPPKLRRQVLRRDRYRCRAEGCGHTQYLEVHHMRPVSHGGQTQLDNLITLCRGCHRTLHERENNITAMIHTGERNLSQNEQTP